ncbi:hypothetical protein ACFFLM_17490 [Deinococcus oregonensis]|uniref:Uncharacterized protein n=1 Tax=Deinococcus oregonensis TaxID=1805970 RepID=A0ABV6B468_9DEIO
MQRLPVLHTVEHGQGVSTARWNNRVEHAYRPTWQQEGSHLGFK